MPNKIVYNNDYGGFNISQEAIDYIEQYCKIHNIDNPLLKYKNIQCIPRHHPALVAAVEKLGKKANSKRLYGSDLRIFETESDKYWIENYDGMETVHTPESLKYYQ